MEHHNQRKAKKEALTSSFEVIAEQWGYRKVNNWDDIANRSKRMLERNVSPWLGSKLVTEIRVVDILEC
jgi:hypothetical protein